DWHLSTALRRKSRVPDEILKCAERNRRIGRDFDLCLFGVSALFGGDCTKLAQQPIRFIVRASREEQLVRRPSVGIASAKRQRPESIDFNRVTASRVLKNLD